MLISMLDPKLREEIFNKLKELGFYGEELERAMEGRLEDLSDVMDVERYIEDIRRIEEQDKEIHRRERDYAPERSGCL